MTIKYDDEEILDHELLKRGPFIGYINPKGQIINYSLLEGERGHDNWRNPVTPYFLSFISYQVVGDRLQEYLEEAKTKWYYKDYENNKYDGFEYSVLRGPEEFGANSLDYDSFIEYLNNNIKKVETYYTDSDDEWDKLIYDLMQFFKKCYSKRDFFYSFGRVINILSSSKAVKMYSKMLESDGYDVSQCEDEFYRDYRIITLMSYFKDILVQYLGYDSIERAIPENDICLYGNIYWPSQGYDFSGTPRILTSCHNPNERFYNWLLMDWDVQRLYRMVWNEEEKRFVRENPTLNFHQSEKEIILAKEIDAIRTLVPKEHRRDYFR